MPTQTFRATSSVVTFWAGVGLAVFLIGDAALRGSWSTVFTFLPGTLLVLWGFWVVLWNTRLTASREHLVVTNLLRVHTLPWARVVGITHRGQIVLETDDGARVTCWGGPFPKRPGVRAPRRDSTSRPTFAQILESYRESAPASAEPVRHAWDLVALGIGALLVVATALTPFVAAG